MAEESREIRRTSILKQIDMNSTKPTLPDFADENEPTFTFSTTNTRRQSRRVSFAEKTVVKEFCKHEALAPQAVTMNNENWIIAETSYQSSTDGISILRSIEQNLLQTVNTTSGTVVMEDCQTLTSSTVVHDQDMDITLGGELLANQSYVPREEQSTEMEAVTTLNEDYSMEVETTTPVKDNEQTSMHEAIVDDHSISQMMNQTDIIPKSLLPIATNTSASAEMDMEFTVLAPDATDLLSKTVEESYIPDPVRSVLLESALDLEAIPEYSSRNLSQATLPFSQDSLHVSALQPMEKFQLTFDSSHCNVSTSTTEQNSLMPLPVDLAIPTTPEKNQSLIKSEQESPKPTSNEFAEHCVNETVYLLVDNFRFSPLPDETGTFVPSMGYVAAEPVKIDPAIQVGKPSTMLHEFQAAQPDVIKSEEDNIPDFMDLLQPAAVGPTPEGKEDSPVPEPSEIPQTTDANADLAGNCAVKVEKQEPADGLSNFMKTWKWRFPWKVSRNDNRLTLSFAKNQLLVIARLGESFVQEDNLHYNITSYEIQYSNAEPNKPFAELGLQLLKNTLTKSDLRKVCSSTRELPLLLNHILEWVSNFNEFIKSDIPWFLVKLDKWTLDNSSRTINCEMSNYDSHVLVGISIALRDVLPLKITKIAIKPIIGTLNVDQLISMVKQITPQSRYLVKVAKCIDDYLRFKK